MITRYAYNLKDKVLELRLYMSDIKNVISELLQISRKLLNIPVTKS